MQLAARENAIDSGKIFGVLDVIRTIAGSIHGTFVGQCLVNAVGSLCI